MPVTLWSSRSNAASIGVHSRSQPSAPLEETGIELLEADLEKGERELGCERNNMILIGREPEGDSH